MGTELVAVISSPGPRKDRAMRAREGHQEARRMVRETVRALLGAATPGAR